MNASESAPRYDGYLAGIKLGYTVTVIFSENVERDMKKLVKATLKI